MDCLLGGRRALGGEKAAEVRVGYHLGGDVAGGRDVGGQLTDVLAGFVDVAEVQESGDGVQPVGVFVGLGAQPVGECSYRVELADHVVELGPVAHRDDDAEITAVALDGLAGDDEHPVCGDGEHALDGLMALDDVSKSW